MNEKKITNGLTFSLVNENIFYSKKKFRNNFYILIFPLTLLSRDPDDGILRRGWWNMDFLNVDVGHVAVLE